MHQSDDLKPPVSLVVASILVIVACLLALASCLASIAVPTNPFAFLGSFVILPVAAFLAVKFYWGTFRSNHEAARLASTVLFAIAGIVLFGIVVNTGEMIVERGDLSESVTPLIVMAAIAVACGLAARASRDWANRLELAGPAVEAAARRGRFSLRELLALTAAVAFVAAIAASVVPSNGTRYAENVTLDKAPLDLPAGATRISYCHGARGAVAYEFTVSENDFVAWVESGLGSWESQAAGVSLKEIDGQHVITRYYALATELSGPDEAVISSGLQYAWFHGDRGVYAAFDRDTGRAYFFAHSH